MNPFINSGCVTWNLFSYCFQFEKKTVVQALAFCNSIGSKLFEPKDLPSNDFVTTEAKARGVSQFWIGIHDIQTEGTFRYDSNNESITWSNWNEGQPNDNGGGEDCTTVGVTQITWASGDQNIDSSHVGQWWDQQCHYLKAFVCESTTTTTTTGKIHV